MRLLVVSFAVAGLWATALSGQKTGALAPPMAIPADRVADSYQIYSSLIPLGETRSANWPHDLWLVQDMTIDAVAPDQPCNPGTTDLRHPGMFSMAMNPHLAIHPPPDGAADYLEIMQDFDLHCHDRLRLDPHAWQMPVRLLNPSEQKNFQAIRSRPPSGGQPDAEYKGAPALYAFSEVYFNRNHSVALVYATHWCGNLCGQGVWVSLARRAGRWVPLNWQSAHWIS